MGVKIKSSFDSKLNHSPGKKIWGVEGGGQWENGSLPRTDACFDCFTINEQVKSLAQFAVELGFLVEEYAASRGTIPPRSRRKKKSVYIATIEKVWACFAFCWIILILAYKQHWKTIQKHYLASGQTWACNMAMWYWSTDTLIWQVSVDITGNSCPLWSEMYAVNWHCMTWSTYLHIPCC